MSSFISTTSESKPQEKKPKSAFRKWVGKIHLWLGLGSGLIVFVVSITGCIYAFQKEIRDQIEPFRFVEAKGTMLPPSELKKIAEASMPGMVSSHVHYEGADRAATASLQGKNGEFYEAFINPYTGEVLKHINFKTDFFTIILYLHFTLLLPYEIGTTIVATTTLIFVVMLISGIIMWWPKNKNARKQRFTIKWGAKWKRVNYDLHNVLGFYMTWVVLFIALTGLVWGFEWFASSTYWIASGGKKMHKYELPVSDTTQLSNQTITQKVDQTWRKIAAEDPNIKELAIYYPDRNSDVIKVYTNTLPGTYYKMDFRYFDQYSLKELSVKHYRGRYNEANGGDMLNRLNYDIHVGAIGGLAGKTLAFFASLIAASLPVTGFLVWRGRKQSQKKKKKKEKKVQRKELKAEAL